ncbi:MAG: radical SAM family heme chaperone HemW [Chitinophagaceae bacterium]
MAGIYIHIPFCRQACHYCNFHFSTSLQRQPEMVEALCEEIRIRKDELTGECIETIYFGGGTPSLLKANELEQIMQKLHAFHSIAANPEITLEANPDDVNGERLSFWRALGVNRLSIGVQSLFNEDLRWMNRVHTAAEAERVINTARKASFEHFSVDLIYGIPTLTDEKWLQNLAWVVQEGVDHISCYALTVEPRTALHHKIAQKHLEEVDPEQQHRHFNMLLAFAEKHGYEQYEISNFAKSGHRSKHNTSYWLGKPYLGIGPGAHSFDGKSRQWNVSNNIKYIDAIKNGVIPCETELLTTVQQLNEYIMTSLRMSEGCNVSFVEERFGKKVAAHLLASAKALKKNGVIDIKEASLVLTHSGKWYADGIAAKLFFEEGSIDM